MNALNNWSWYRLHVTSRSQTAALICFLFLIFLNLSTEVPSISFQKQEAMVEISLFAVNLEGFERVTAHILSFPSSTIETNKHLSLTLEF